MSTKPLRVGFIGTGRKQERPSAAGFAMAYQHAAAYKSLPQGTVDLVACADISEENGRAFVEVNGLQRWYPTHQAMLEHEPLDMVSICVWPHLHAPMVIDTAAAGVKAIHCEKPMADSWGAARRMVQACEERGVQLTFNHQRRFGLPFSKAREIASSGEIGDLVRLEAACADIYDWGTHYFDMLGSYNQESPAEWVMAQIDYRTEKRIFGAHVENQAIVWWKYKNGVHGLMATGPGQRGIGCNNRLIGTKGTVEVGVHAPDQAGQAGSGQAGEPGRPPRQGPVLRVWREGAAGWEIIDCGKETLHGPNYIDRAIADAIDALKHNREPALSARRALNATEIIFAAYESSRRRSRVDLPLQIDDHPLLSLVESGALKPQPAT